MNGQSAALNLNNEQLQVLISGKLGDGCFPTPKNSTMKTYYTTCCKFEEYIDFKAKLLGDLFIRKEYLRTNGYSGTEIWRMFTHCSSDITEIRNMDIESILELMDELGIALWFYDDGSMHNSKNFYNLNTQAFPEEIQRELFVPFFEKRNIKAVPTIERKKDGRQFWYLRIGRYEGAYEIVKMLRKYPVKCYDYKVWSSQTILNWSKMQEHLKSTGKLNCSIKEKSIILSRINQNKLT